MGLLRKSKKQLNRKSGCAGYLPSALALSIMMAWAVASHAGKDVIATDRPDFVESGAVLGNALDRDTQLDAAINLGLNRFTPDTLFTVGFSWRFH